MTIYSAFISSQLLKKILSDRRRRRTLFNNQGKPYKRYKKAKLNANRPENFYDAMVRSLIALVHTITWFTLVAPLALVVDYLQKGPHFFPRQDQSIAFWICGLSIMTEWWIWRLYASAQLVIQDTEDINASNANNENVDEWSQMGGLPLVGFAVAFSCYWFFDYTKFYGPTDAFWFDSFTLTLCNTPSDGDVTQIAKFSCLITVIFIYGFCSILLNEPVVRRSIELFVRWGPIQIYSKDMNEINEMRGDQPIPRNQITVLFEKFEKNKKKKIDEKIRGVIDLCLGIIFGFVFMFMFHRYRRRGKWVPDYLSVEADWNFGQILALTTLFPVFFEFFAHLSKLFHIIIPLNTANNSKKYSQNCPEYLTNRKNTQIYPSF